MPRWAQVVVTVNAQVFGSASPVALEPVEETGFFKKLWQRILSLVQVIPDNVA